MQREWWWYSSDWTYENFSFVHTRIWAGDWWVSMINILNDRYGDTVILIRQITKQYSKFDHAWNHINDHTNMANDTTLRQKEEFLTILNILFNPLDNQTVQELKKNVAILIKNFIKKPLLGTNTKAISIAKIYFAKHRYMINWLVNALKSIYIPQCIIVALKL